MTRIIQNYFPIAYHNSLGFSDVPNKIKLITLLFKKVFYATLTVGSIPVDIIFNAVLIPIRSMQGLRLKVVTTYRKSNYFLQTDFYKSGNVSSIEDAELIFLNNKSTTERDREINDSIVKRYCRLNDAVVLRHEKSLNKLMQVTTHIALASLATFCFTILLPRSDTPTIALDKVIRFFSKFELSNFLKEYNVPLKHLNRFLQAIPIFGASFSLLKILEARNLYIRNEKMCNTIDSNLNIRRKVFIVDADMDMPTIDKLPPKLSSILNRVFYYGYLPVKNLLEDKNYIILTPR